MLISYMDSVKSEHSLAPSSLLITSNMAASCEVSGVDAELWMNSHFKREDGGLTEV